MGIREEKHVESRTNNQAKEKPSSSSSNRSNTNGVLITVYVESTILIPSRRKNDPIKRFNPNRSAHGYDRRAQFLAYAQELRNSISQQEEFTMNNSRPRAAKKWRWSPFRRLFHHTRSQWRYEHIATDEEGEADSTRKRKCRGRIYSRICGRLRCMLRELSCAW